MRRKRYIVGRIEGALKTGNWKTYATIYGRDTALRMATALHKQHGGSLFIVKEDGIQTLERMLGAFFRPEGRT